MLRNIVKLNIQFVIFIILILFTLPFLGCENKAPEQSIDEKLGFDPKMFEQYLKDALTFN